MADDLDPMAPADVVDLYLQTRESELSKSSRENQRYRLRSFVEFCEEQGIDTLDQLTGRHLHEFRVWRKNGESERYGEVNNVTLYGVLQTLRVFLEFAASIDAVEPGMRERVLLPEIDPEEERRDELLEEDRAEDIVSYLSRYRYASREHVIMAILWHTGMRLGSLRSLDVDDYDPTEPCLTLSHQPESGTPLKNSRGAERDIYLSEQYSQLIREYIEQNRHNVIDEYGRRPLITSEQGRLTATPIRRIVYRWTQPCRIGGCPHDEDPETCEWRHYEQLRDCPSSRSPHGVRRGSITMHRRRGVPREVVSDRADASADVLEAHYDRRSKRERMRNRKEFLDDI
ncbi:MAG: tyrosine-type recombinase/integrase [archaeon]